METLPDPKAAFQMTQTFLNTKDVSTTVFVEHHYQAFRRLAPKTHDIGSNLADYLQFCSRTSLVLCPSIKARKLGR